MTSHQSKRTLKFSRQKSRPRTEECSLSLLIFLKRNKFRVEKTAANTEAIKKQVTICDIPPGGIFVRLPIRSLLVQ